MDRGRGPERGPQKTPPQGGPTRNRNAAPGSSGVQPTPENGVRLRLWPPWKIRRLRQPEDSGDLPPFGDRNVTISHVLWTARWVIYWVGGTQVAFSKCR